MSQSSNQNNPQQQDPTQNASQSPTPSTNEDLLKHLMAALGPVLEFHKSVEHASDNDLRLFWDIRLVQGKDTPFTSMSGHSSFPGMLVGSSLGQLPSVMSREIVEKIAVPLAARLQDMTNEQVLGTVMKNVVPIKKPAKPALGTLKEVSTEEILPDSERDEIIDVMLPKEIVADAADIMAELKNHE